MIIESEKRVKCLFFMSCNFLLIVHIDFNSETLKKGKTKFIFCGIVITQKKLVMVSLKLF